MVPLRTVKALRLAVRNGTMAFLLVTSLAVQGWVADARAASVVLGVSTLPNPEVTATVDIFNDPFGFGFDATGLLAGASTAPAAGTLLDIFISGDIDPGGTAGILNLAVLDGVTDFLAADTLLSVGFQDDLSGSSDIIELLFGDISADPIGAFGSQVLVVLTGEFGSDPFGTGFGDANFPMSASLTINPVDAVPLPAASVLLVSALGCLAFGRHLYGK